MDLKQKILDVINFRSFYEQHLGCQLSDKTQQNVLCCFHDDTEPSLSINLSNGVFHCKSVSCIANLGGGFLDFYSLRYSVDFVTELNNVAEDVGVSKKKIVPEDEISKYRKILAKSPKRLE